jgi:hypothetical protein
LNTGSRYKFNREIINGPDNIIYRRSNFLAKFDDDEYCDIFNKLKKEIFEISSWKIIIRRILEIDIMKFFIHHIIFWINPKYQFPQRTSKTRKNIDWAIILTEHDFNTGILKSIFYFSRPMRSDCKKSANIIIRKIFENICSNRIS